MACAGCKILTIENVQDGDVAAALEARGKDAALGVPLVPAESAVCAAIGAPHNYDGFPHGGKTNLVNAAGQAGADGDAAAIRSGTSESTSRDAVPAQQEAQDDPIAQVCA